MACLMSRIRLYAYGQIAGGIFRDDFANPPVQTPARTTTFWRAPGFIETQMPDFSFARRGTVKNPTFGNQAAAHAAADGHIKHRTRPASRSETRLSECCHIGVILNAHRNAA